MSAQNLSVPLLALVPKVASEELASARHDQAGQVTERPVWLLTDRR
jgi:hypothetical protein